MVFHLLKCIVHVHTLHTVHPWWNRLFRRWTENLPLRQVLPPLPPSNYIHRPISYISDLPLQSPIIHSYVAFTCHSGVPFILSFMCRNPHIIVQASHLVIIQVSQPTHSSSGVPFIHCDCVAITLSYIVRRSHPSFIRYNHLSLIRHTHSPFMRHIHVSFIRRTHLSFMRHNPSPVHVSISLAAWSLLDLVFSLT